MCAFIQAGTHVHAIQAWEVTYPDPLTLRAGEQVGTGKQDEEWPGWIWCTDLQGKSGWAPLSWLEVDEPGKTARARREYTAAELAIQPGERLVIQQVESGWGWAVKDGGQSGWIPLSHVESDIHLIEEGVFDIPLLLAPELESQREPLQARLIEAQRRLKKFATAHNWLELMQTPFARQARIFASKEKFDHDLLELAGMEPTIELPKTYCAALEQDVLVSVSPALYTELYPEGDEPHGFEKLLTHEMAHRLHIRILNGDEERMGPIWFYEGFALYAASQFEGAMPVLSTNELWETVQTEERIDYRRYAAAFYHFSKLVPLQELVERAGDAGFHDWLRKN